ncbi:MAG: acyl-CoA dehydrogenase family protein [Myxococcota bacterium]|nr:acyl-CoA dehydrogenase family protein [Myxococcota bacterium]
MSEEQELLQETVRRFAAGDLPAARLREIFDQGSAFDAALWRGAAGVGVQGLVVPERFGGAGLELLDLALAFEVLGETALPGPFLGHALATLALALGGSEAQQERWLPALASGEAVGSLAIAEAGDLWEPPTWRSSLADGALHGTKMFVEHGTLADLLVVGVAGGGLALVERGAAGVGVEAVDGVDRTRALATIAFEGAAAEALPGGGEVADAVLDGARILLAADAFGAAWKLVRMTVDYALTREQFGTPIAQFQGVKHQLANLAAELEPARGLFWYAAHVFDHMPDERPAAAAAAKAHITDQAVKLGRACIELHGGIGFTWECDVQFWAKRVLFDRTWLGSPAAHRERVAVLERW